MLGDMQVHLALEYTLHIALTIVVQGRLSVAQALKCLPKERCESSSGQTVRTFPYVILQNSPQGLEHFATKMRNDNEKGSLPLLLLGLWLFLLL